MKKITVKDVMSQVDGIGVSKSSYRQTTDLKSENGRDYSDKIHSFGSKENFGRFISDLSNFAKEKGFQNSSIRLDNITFEVFKSYLKEKIEGGITKRTVSNIISLAEKLSIALNKLSLSKNGIESKFANQKELIAIKAELRKFAKDNIHLNRAIANNIAEKIVNSISNEKVKIAATLQLKVGLRESEATKIKNWQIKGDTVDIQGKGGYHREALINKEIYDKITGYINNKGSFAVSRSTYETHLRAAFEKNGIKYNGTHSLRYTYAQNRFIEKVELGIDNKEALRQVSEEMGHHRPDITLTYLK